MDHAAEFRRCLTDCDVTAMRALWAHVQPGLPQPKTDAEALATIHVARTAAASIPLRLRAYSHAWLTERGLPSQLPDAMRPAAERMFPRVVSAVGVSVKATAPWRKQEAAAMQAAMSDAVAEAYMDGRREPEFVRARMRDARDKFLRNA